MPYDRNSDLPKQTSGLSAHQKTVFRKAFNSSRKRYDDEETAFRVAWSAAKKAGYEPVNKQARDLMVITKVARYMMDPCGDPNVKALAADFVKQSFDFGAMGDMLGNAAGAIGSGISYIGSSIGSGMSSLGSGISSALAPMMSMDPNQIISKLNAMSPEISGLISQLNMQGWSAADIVKELPQDIISAVA